MSSSEWVLAIVVMVGAPCMIGLFITVAASGMKAAKASRRLADEVRKVSPETHQYIWGDNAFVTRSERLSQFLASDNLNDSPSVRQEKLICRQAENRFNKAFSLVLLMFAIVILLIVLSLVPQVFRR